MSELTDKELCDALFEAGILESYSPITGVTVYRLVGEIEYHSAMMTLQRWAVAGPCLERMDIGAISDAFVEIQAIDDDTFKAALSLKIKDPRAIITAFVESRQ